MGAVRTGRRFNDGPLSVDTFHISQSQSNLSGVSVDLLQFLPNNTNPPDRNLQYPDELSAQFQIVNASGNDGYDVDVRVKFAYDNADYPDGGSGDSLGNFYSGTAGDDLNWSNEVIFIPQQRYMHFEYDNNNSTDGLDILSRIYVKW